MKFYGDGRKKRVFISLHFAEEVKIQLLPGKSCAASPLSIHPLVLNQVDCPMKKLNGGGCCEITSTNSYAIAAVIKVNISLLLHEHCQCHPFPRSCLRPHRFLAKQRLLSLLS